MNQSSGRALDPRSNNAPAPAAPVAQGEASGSKFNEPWRVNGGWENIPPYRQLKVLLVEDDDSTRHVVAALLRNCGYQVVSVANGLQAWALLMDELGRDLDLVLTDVVMPGLSGIGLLTRMMHRESLKKIPVIMMSSHDSTDVVFKCLSKGAADFLVKPVRKNELRNLWQHSWRRCQNSGESEGETGKLVNACGENEMKSESGSEDLQVSDQSDTTQSSCTKKSMVELEIPVRPRGAHQLQNARRRSYCPGADPEPAETARPIPEDEEPGPSDSERVSSPAEAADLIGTIADERPGGNEEQLQTESEMGGSNSPEAMKDSSSDPTSTSKLELSLKSLCPGDEQGNVWRQSAGASAFSRYNTAGASGSPPKRSQNLDQENHHAEITRNVDEGACSSPARDPPQQPLLLTPEQQHLMSFAAQPYPVQYAALLAFDQQKSMGATTYYYAQPGGVPPWQHAFSPQDAGMILEQQQRQIQTFTNMLAHHHQLHVQNQNHQHQHQVSSVNRESPPGSNKEAPGCGSTNAPDGVSNQFTNGFSGSSHGNNGSMCGSNTGNLTPTTNNCGAGNNGCGAARAHQMGGGANLNGEIGSGANLSSPVAGVNLGPEQNRFRREAALNKFRLKRKERCFEKKVRYQSRKRLAEQRPRVRGQFVSQAVYDSAINHA